MEGRQQGKRFRLPVCCSKGHITAEQLSPVDAKKEQDTGLAAFLMANATGWQPYAAASVMPNASATTASSAVVCCRCVYSGMWLHPAIRLWPGALHRMPPSGYHLLARLASPTAPAGCWAPAGCDVTAMQSLALQLPSATSRLPPGHPPFSQKVSLKGPRMQMSSTRSCEPPLMRHLMAGRGPQHCPHHIATLGVHPCWPQMPQGSAKAVTDLHAVCPGPNWLSTTSSNALSSSSRGECRKR